LLLVAACWSAPASVRADPIPTDEFQVDLFQGPLLAPLRVTALGGAYAGYGEDLAGMVANAASTAVRPIRESRHVELGASASISIPIDIFENNDFDNSGDLDTDTSDFIYVTGGAVLKIGAFGVGATSEVQRYDIDIDGPSGTTTSPVTFSKTRVQAAWGGLGGQIHAGGGVRVITMGLDYRAGNQASGSSQFIFVGAAPEFGLLVKPVALPLRFGVTYRFAAKALEVTGGESPALLTLPRAVRQPWELETGLAFQLGPRPFNVYFVDPEDADDEAEARVRGARELRKRQLERELARGDSAGDPELSEAREADLEQLEQRWLEATEQELHDQRDNAVAAMPREHVLVLLSLLATGPVENGISVERFLSQTTTNDPPKIGSSGGAVNFSPRFGIEAEPIENWLVVRGGSYYEPNRFGGVGRQHFTFGAQLRVFSSDFWGFFPEWPYGVEVAMDLAPRYESISASVALFR
jgi:hypothetical protein